MSYSYQEDDQQVMLYEGLEGLLEIKSEWNSLFDRLEKPAYYQDWRWNYLIVKWLAKTPVFFAVLRKAKEAVMIVPLQGRKISKGGLRHCFVGFPSHSHIVLSDVVCDLSKVESSDLDFLLNNLAAQKIINWSVLELTGFSSESQTFRLLTQGKGGIREKSTSAYFKVEHGNFQDGLSKKFIKNIRRLENKAEREIGPVTVCIEDPNQDLKARFETFLEMEASGWKGESGTLTAIKHDATLVSFYNELISEFSKDNRFAIHLLYLGGKPAASQLCIRFDSVWFLLKVAYDENMRDYGAGNLLMLKVLEAASAHDSIVEVNLVTAPEWSKRWHLETRDVFAYQAFNSNLKGRFTRAIADARKRVKSIAG